MNNQPVRSPSTQTDFVIDDDDMDSDTVAESDMSFNSRSFLHRVNDRVRKMQDQSSKDATQDSNKHSLIWGMCISSTLEASVFVGKNYLENVHSIKNTGKDLRMKQMFNISEKLIAEQSDEIYGVTPINWEDSSWKHLSLVGDEEVISLLYTMVYVFFRFCIKPWKDEREPTIKSCMGRQIDVVHEFTTVQNFGQNLWPANGIRVEQLPRIHHIAALQQSPRVHV